MPRTPSTHPQAFPAPAPRSLTGAVELAVADAAAAASRPARVTALLCAALDSIGGERATPDLARRLSAGTREWLLQRAAAAFAPGVEWCESYCAACGARYDIEVRLDEPPLTPAGPGFPLVEVDTTLGRLAFEAPNGGHEERLAAARDAAGDGRRRLAALCLLEDDPGPVAARLSEEDLDALDSALEAVCPDVADTAEALCPDCGAATVAQVEPFAYAFPRAADVLTGAHLIASAYGWSEADILALPSRRRDFYAAAVRAERRAAAPRRLQ